MQKELEKPTHAQAVAIVQRQVKMEICKALHWNEMQYAQMQYHNGLAYLHWLLMGDDEGRDQLERSGMFWNWFKHQWYIHDVEFLHAGLEGQPLDVKLDWYNDIHNPRALAAEVRPNRIVLDQIIRKKSSLTLITKP